MKHRWFSYLLRCVTSRLEEYRSLGNFPRGVTDCYKNLMACYLYHPQSFLKISLKSVHNFLSNPANRQTKQTNRQTGKQTKATENITSAKLRFDGGKYVKYDLHSSFVSNDVSFTG